MLLIVCRPFLISSLETCASVSPSSVSLREVMGVTAFIISCVSTRVSLIQESISFSSSSLLMSFRARMRRCSLRTVMSLCEKFNLYIMNDEIWSDIVFPEEPFRSIYSLGSKRCRRVMSVFGFSKSFGIAGLRAGCVYTTDEKLFEEIVENSDVMSTAGGIASISQIAGTACMSKCYYWVDAFLEHLKKNRDYAVDRLNQMPMIKAYRPHATYLLYVDIRAFGMKSEEFTDYMKEKVKLAVVSGGEKFFGSGSEGYIRICFATSHEILEEGLNRLEKGIDMLIREKNLEK